MDKITEGIIDKLSIIGFFNVILSGGVLLYGISPILDQYFPGIFYNLLGLESDLEKAVVLCVSCYILGSALQVLQEKLFKILKSSVANKCLGGEVNVGDGMQGKSVLSNQYKRDSLIKLADKLFAEKNLGEFDPDDKEKCSFFIDYCDYMNSISGFGSKASKLSESATFFEQLAIAFYALVVFGIPVLVYANTNEWVYCVVYLILGGLFTGRAYQYRLDWAKAVLSTFQTVSDIEEAKRKDRGICPIVESITFKKN